MAKAAGLRRTLTKEQGNVMDELSNGIQRCGEIMVNYWLMKSEPHVYPWAQLVEDQQPLGRSPELSSKKHNA